MQNGNLSDTSWVLNHAAHELRNPLATILGFAELLKDRPREQEKLEIYLGYILEKAKKMQYLLDAILDISRYEIGKPIRIETSSQDMAGLVEEAVKAMTDNYPDARVETNLAAATVFIDGKRLKAALGAVLDNAFRFSAPRPLVKISGKKVKSHYVLLVEDNGPGILPDHLSQVFQAFFAQDGQNGAGKGSGLGLTLAKVYTELMGGVIEILSSGKQGTKVQFRFTV